MDIRFYDFDFNLRHIESNIISSNWTVHNNDVGSFEIHVPISSPIAAFLNENLNYGENKMLVLLQGSLQGIITGFLLKDDCAIFGKTCNWLLEKRVVYPFKSTDISQNDITAGAIARHICENAFSDVLQFCVDDETPLDNVYSSASQFWRNVCHSVQSVISDLCSASGAGHFVHFDTKNKKWVLKFTKNRQSDAIISQALKNASNTEFSYSLLNCADDGVYESEVFDSDGMLVGFEWKTCKKNEKSGIYRWEEILESTTETEAISALNQRSVLSDIYSDTSLKAFEFGKNIFLGDIITLQYVCGNFKKAFKKLVDGITLSFDDGKKSMQLIFKEV